MLTEEEVQSNLRNPSFDVESEINLLRKKKNAIILSHYYQNSEIQDIADFVGDSLDLSRTSLKTDADIIIFSGVVFMAEVANVLNSNARVFVPDVNAGCSLEQSCPPKEFAKFCEQNQDHLVISYINCSAEVKAMSDIICTSTNAVKIVNSIPKDKPIIFAPDRHLGAYISKQTNRDMKLWNGSCIVHERFSEQELVKLIAKHENAIVIAHPECTQEVLRHANVIGSTSKLLKTTEENPNSEFIVLTEPGIIHQMKKVSTGSTFHNIPFFTDKGACVSCNNCSFMKLNTLEKIYSALATESPKNQIILPEDIRLKARNALQKMLDI